MHMIHRNRSRATLLAVLLLVVLPSAARAQVGSISGRVTEDRSGRPIESAQVNIVGTTIGALANTEGRYMLRGVRPGAYQVRVLRVGYAESKQSVTVTADQATVASTKFAVAAWSAVTVTLCFDSA